MGEKKIQTVEKIIGEESSLEGGKCIRHFVNAPIRSLVRRSFPSGDVILRAFFPFPLVARVRGARIVT